MDYGYQTDQGFQDNQDKQAYLLQDLSEKNNIDELNSGTGEVQLLAMISNKEYFCYAIKVKGKDYLMFTDNKVNLEFVKSNYNIIVMEDNVPQTIKLIYLDNGFIKKTIGNVTVSFVRYAGKLNSKNIIKYNDSYFSSVFNSVLKDYENHLNELVKDIKYFELNPINERKAEAVQTKEKTITTRKIKRTNNFPNFPNISTYDAERIKKRIFIFNLLITLFTNSEFLKFLKKLKFSIIGLYISYKSGFLTECGKESIKELLSFFCFKLIYSKCKYILSYNSLVSFGCSNFISFNIAIF